MPVSSPVSRRYATALVESAAAGGTAAIELAAEELTRFAATAAQSPDLRTVLMNPVFTSEERARVLGGVMEKLSLSPRVRRFLELVASKDRILEIDAIARAVRRMADERAGRVRAEVQSAGALTPDDLDALKSALERRTGRSVEIDMSVDPTLLGGLRARIGSTVLDGTLRAQLERMREAMNSAE